MPSIRALVLLFPTVLVACATAVSQDFIDDEGDGAAPGGGLSNNGGKTSSGGKAGSPAAGGKASGKGGTGTQAFGGTASNGGDASDGGEDSGGTGGGATAGSGGKATAGSAGAPNGGSSGSGGGGGSGGSPVGSGDCAGTPLFQVGAGTKYAKMAKVVAVCTVGTPCTMANPPAVSGKQYEFSCLDEYNCGTQDPGTTNWAQPPWAMTKACE